MEWNEVKEKPKKQTKKHDDEEEKPQYGGKGAKGKLIAGPVRNGQMHAEGARDHAPSNDNAATHIAEFDYYVDDDKFTNEIKYETVSHECAQAVQEARLAAKMTQEKLAHTIGQKTSIIHDIENGSAKYNANVINDIERALSVKIPRGRKKK
uniref:HTH cro/C1-type domain-containing protein n=1 Tax=Strombidium inclinatum TaxID=197538 RepID=A0A7S3MXX3_9SPIT|mmetsp:Transcript_19605/g.30202  ORF Transcript_19605/g.30202 Transcript_19605/m.30202 type:complete len:152 (+) Transcript_19605:37-492(+)|eukprot:CAMPEP_0170491084 /NCGR_PEP_ID=MMETSP0208-20121228/10351_1 /TAXON_ID=197538 /ORGANISM="Strombidium inclinatum, Strain S3" /LENGTH=151 /DNA_ID=CAMNT_0010766595 /DNA_START=12 /DNA_END=467 /DNA_ORIENTATION=+